MEVNAKRAFELLNKLSFERVSCTAEETRTAEALLAEIDSFTWARSDIQREIEVFKASTGTVTAARLIVTEPYEKEYPVTAYLRSDSTPDDGLELELVYVETRSPQICSVLKVRPFLSTDDSVLKLTGAFKRQNLPQ